jgi:Carbohydrate binding domain
LIISEFAISLPGFVPNTPRAGRVDFVNNGAFEYGSLNGWTSSRAVLDSFSGYFSGGYSALLLRGGWLVQRLTGLTPNTTYVASAWVRVGGNNQSANLAVRNFGRTTVTKAVASASTFQRVTLEFTTGATNTTAELVFEKPLGTATAIGDLFSVVRK